VANVEGAIALVSWEQYQDIVENQQTNIQLVAVKNGDDRRASFARNYSKWNLSLAPQDAPGH
jgi:hypothetical protein